MRHLTAHSRLAMDVGLPEENIFVLENGTPLELTQNTARRGKPVESGVVYVDGLSVGDVSNVVLRDRQHLARDGIITIVVAIDRHSGKAMSDPTLDMRGVVFAPDDEKLLADASARISKILARTSNEGATDRRVVEKALHDSFSQFIWDRTRSRPMVVPTVLEV